MTTFPSEMFSPTERRFMHLLKDGQPHHRRDFEKLLDDDLSSVNAIQAQISRLRAKLKPHRYTILCAFPNGRAIHYQLCPIPDPVSII
jgi:hypothetical protein